MELDLRIVETKTDEILSVLAPHSVLNDATSPDRFMTLGAPCLKQLAKIYSPTLVHSLLETAGEDVLKIKSVLLSSAAAQESEFWGAVGRFIPLATEQGIDFLGSEGLLDCEQKDISKILATAVVEQPEVVGRVLKRLYEIADFQAGGRSYAIFHCALPPSKMAPLFESLDIKKLEEVLKPYFEERKYGPHCTILPIRGDGRFGFQIDRGGRSLYGTQLDLRELEIPSSGRPIKTDIILYIAETNTLWVSTRSPADAVELGKKLAQLTGHLAIFREKHSFVLSSLFQNDVASVISEIERRLQVEIEIKTLHVERADGEDIILKADSQHTCVTRKFPGHAAFSASNSVKLLRIKAIVDRKEKRFGFLNLRKGSVKADGEINEVLATNLMVGLGLMRLHENA